MGPLDGLRIHEIHHLDLYGLGLHSANMAEVTTLKLDKQGRITVPKPVRQALGVDGESAVVRIELEVRDGETISEVESSD